MSKRIILIITIIVATIIGLLMLLIKNNFNERNNNENSDNQEYIENLSNINIGNVTKIVCKNNYKENEKEKEDIYNIINKEKINKIVNLIEEDKINEITNNITNIDYIELSFFNIDKEINLIVYNNNSIRINGNDYKVNNELYNEIIKILKDTYYLHKSNISVPSTEESKEMQSRALNGLKDEDIKEVQKKLRNAHVTMEYLLIDGTKNLKESNSVYWELYNNAETITEPNGEKLDFTSNDCFNAIAKNINKIKEIVKDANVKKDFEEIYKRMQNAMENKDIAEMFKIHEKIHDYDYWIINFPAYFDTAPAPDWEGIEIYFGNKI